MTPFNVDFWTSLDAVVAAYPVMLDRPRGSAHPDYPDAVYPADYGYLAGTAAMDGEAVDIWIGSSGLAQADGIICAVNTAKQDIEIKILYSCTAAEMAEILAWMSRGSQHGLLVRRD